MVTALQPYNVTLDSSSPTFIYLPYRDGYYEASGDPSGGWRAAYSNETTYPGAGLYNIGSGIPYRETYLNGANVTLHFEGTGVYLCLSNIGTSYTFAIDGEAVSTPPASGNDSACANSGALLVAYSAGLEYQNHTAVIEVFSTSDSPDFLFYGGVVTVGLQGMNPKVVQISAVDPAWNYSPGPWTLFLASTGDSANSTYTCQYGSPNSASYTFNGTTGVELLGMADLNLGPFTVTLDDMSFTGNASNFWRQSGIVVFFAGNLDPTVDHTITYINFNQAYPDATQPIGDDYEPCAVVNGLRLIQASPISPTTTSGSPPTTLPIREPPTSSSAPVGAIVGGVIGGIIVFIAFVTGFLYVQRRRARRRPSTSLNPSQEMVEPSPYPRFATSSVPSNSTRSGRRERKTAVAQSQPSTASVALPGSSLSGSGIVDPAVQSGSASFANASSSHDSRVARPERNPVNVARALPVTDIMGASTAELVQVLNSRLRAEFYQEEGTEPPEYDGD